MIEKIIDYLKVQRWVYNKSESNSNLSFPLTGVNGLFHCWVIIEETQSLFTFITYLGTNCPSDRKVETVKLLNRVNANLLYGNFEMNINGEIKYRTSICYEDIIVTTKVIENIILRNIYNIDLAAPFLSRFMFGSITEDEVYTNFFPPQIVKGKEPRTSSPKIRKIKQS